MIDRKVRSERFRWGISVLDAYLYYSGKENFHDINIVSENFFSDLLKYTVRGKGNEKEFVVSKHRFRC